jgi:predicted DNA-binding protein (UPF0251 family)
MSPRYKKPRRCECPFREMEGRVFKPSAIPMSRLDHVLLYHDEVEPMRLSDARNLTQEEAGARMGISRGTVQRLLASGRGKVIDAIVGQKALILAEGHNVRYGAEPGG